MRENRLETGPGRGNVYACPYCGTVAVFQCYHDETGEVRTVAMNAAKAAHLRRHGELRPPRMDFVCDDCGYTGPMERGMTIGAGKWCAACSGRSERQVREARRQVAS